MKVVFDRCIALIACIASKALNVFSQKKHGKTSKPSVPFPKAKTFCLSKLNLLLLSLLMQAISMSSATAAKVDYAGLGTYTGYSIYGYMDHSIVRQYFEQGNKSVGLYWQGSGEYTFEIEKRNEQAPWQPCGSGDEGSSYSRFEITNPLNNTSEKYFGGGCNYDVGEAITEVRLRRGSGDWYVVDVPLIAPFLPRADLVVQSTADTTGNITYVNLKRMLGVDGVELQFHAGNYVWQSLPVEQITLNKGQNRLEITNLQPSQHYFRLRSTRNNEVSNWINLQVAHIPLGKPAPIQFDPVYYGGYNASWQSVFGATEYYYDINELQYNIWHSINRSTTETTLTGINTLATGRFQLRVRARAASGVFSDWQYSQEINVVEEPGIAIPNSLSVEPYVSMDNGFHLFAGYTKDKYNRPIEQYRFEVQVDNGEWFTAYFGRNTSLRLSWNHPLEGLILGEDNQLKSGLYRFRVRTEGKYDPEGYHSDWQMSEYYPIGDSVSDVPSPSVINTHVDA
jgi:hypothetical protein